MALEERDYRFSPQRKTEIQKQLLEDKELPELPYEIDRISYLDGLKIYLKDGGWISVRFSGTCINSIFAFDMASYCHAAGGFAANNRICGKHFCRDVLIFCEMKDQSEAAAFCEIFEAYLSLK